MYDTSSRDHFRQGIGKAPTAEAGDANDEDVEEALSLKPPLLGGGGEAAFRFTTEAGVLVLTDEPEASDMRSMNLSCFGHDAYNHAQQASSRVTS